MSIHLRTSVIRNGSCYTTFRPVGNGCGAKEIKSNDLPQLSRRQATIEKRQQLTRFERTEYKFA